MEQAEFKTLALKHRKHITYSRAGHYTVTIREHGVIIRHDGHSWPYNSTVFTKPLLASKEQANHIGDEFLKSVKTVTSVTI